MPQVYRHISPSGKSYVGETKFTWQERAGGNPLTSYAGCSKFFYAIKKYGWSSFEHEILAEGSFSKEELRRMEASQIKEFNSIIEGYNLKHHNDLWLPDGIFLPNASNVAKTYLSGFSIRDTAFEYDIPFAVVSHLLAKENVTPRRNGEMTVNELRKRHEQSWAFKAVPIMCQVCGVNFTPKFQTTKTCSRVCAAKINYSNPWKSKKISSDARTQKAITMSKTRSTMSSDICRKNAIASTHARWHVKRNVYNANCSLCNLSKT